MKSTKETISRYSDQLRLGVIQLVGIITRKNDNDKNHKKKMTEH